MMHSVTNLPNNLICRDWNRNYIVEYIAEDLTALHLVHEISKHQPPLFINASRFMTNWSGKDFQSSAAFSAPTDEYVLDSAIEKRLQTYGEASLVIDPANIAILALPTTMSLVPAVYIVDINMPGMVLSGFFSESCQQCPFFSKASTSSIQNPPLISHASSSLETIL